MKDILKAKSEFVELLGNLEGIQGIGITKINDEIVFLVNLFSNVPKTTFDKIPVEFHGYKVTVEYIVKTEFL